MIHAAAKYEPVALTNWGEGGELLRREEYEATVQAEDAAGLADDAARLQY